MTRRRSARSNLALVLAAGAILAACSSEAGAPAPPSVSVTFANPATAPPATGAPASTLPDTTHTPVPAHGPPVLGEPLAVLDEPVDLAVRPGDTGLYLVERPGRVRLVRDGMLRPEVLLDISDLTQSRGERGLLGLAFSPDGTTAYVNYTDLDGHTVVAGYPVDANGMFDTDARFVVLTIKQPYPNHNGGAVVTGPDGLLYVPTGDGGSANDPQRLALDVGSLLGKVLRLRPIAGGGYEVPDDNPFVGVEGARAEIWSVGLRNPWRVSFDRATGDLWIADVGQGSWEEVSVAWADEGLGKGMSFGWSAFEGTHRFHDDQPADGHIDPIFEYPHGEAGCSISGGVRYRGEQLPGLQGSYVFGDYCSGRVWLLPVTAERTAGPAVEIGRAGNVAAVREGPDGELYVLSLAGPVLPVVSAGLP